MKINNVKNSVFLFFAALIWGTAFVFQSMGNDYMQPFTFSAARNFLGFIVLIPVVLIKITNSRRESTKTKIPFKITLFGGICCGLALTTASLFQQYGVKYTSVGKAGFITTLYIIITPILGIFLKRKCPWSVWIGAAASIIGMYFLCITDEFSISIGDILVFICAILFSVHILIVDNFAPKTDGVILSCIQFFVCFAISAVLALIFDAPTLKQITDGIIPVLYAGVMSSGVAYTFQILGQKNFNPTAAAMILSLESVISAISGYISYSFGFLSQDQSLTIIQILGCAIIFGAVIFIQIPIDKLKRHK
ncbi:MAG: DMT family transporter [Ruminococcus sp.]|nr:DMT family transporter [Ruminococcus sp.]